MLSFLDAEFRETGLVVVRDGAREVTGLNELEFVGALLLANIYPTAEVVAVDPDTGQVVGRLDLSPLAQPMAAGGGGVANGIAFDPAHRRLFVTGKEWPRLFEIAFPGFLGGQGEGSGR